MKTEAQILAEQARIDLQNFIRQQNYPLEILILTAIGISEKDSTTIYTETTAFSNAPATLAKLSVTYLRLGNVVNKASE